MLRTNEGGKEALADLLREFPTWGDAALHYKAENERLRAALHKAGDRLMQVQPAIDTDCTWALDIVPTAQREIEEVLAMDDDLQTLIENYLLAHGFNHDQLGYWGHPDLGQGRTLIHAVEWRLGVEKNSTPETARA